MNFVNSRFINVLYRSFWYTKLYLYNRIFIRNIQTKGLCWWIDCSLFNLHVLLFLWMSACHHAQRNCLPYQCVGHDSNSPFQTICIFITNNYIFYFWKKKVLSFLFKSELDIATWCLFAIANLGNNIYGLFQPMVIQVHANKVSFIEERDWGRGDI